MTFKQKQVGGPFSSARNNVQKINSHFDKLSCAEIKVRLDDFMLREKEMKPTMREKMRVHILFCDQCNDLLMDKIDKFPGDHGIFKHILYRPTQPPYLLICEVVTGAVFDAIQQENRDVFLSEEGVASWREKITNKLIKSGVSSEKADRIIDAILDGVLTLDPCVVLGPKRVDAQNIAISIIKKFDLGSEYKQ